VEIAFKAVVACQQLLWFARIVVAVSMHGLSKGQRKRDTHRARD